MARQPRLCSPGHAHLVQLQSAPDAQPLADAAQRDQFVRWMREGLQAGALRLHAYTVLPQAVRLLLTPQSAAQLSTFVQGLARRTSRALGRADPDPAPVWAGRFRSAVVQPGQWELAAMVWIDRAAEHADGLAAVDWRWSSHAAHCGQTQAGQVAPPLSLPAVYWALGNTPFEREAAYRERLQQGLDDATESALERALRSGTAVGDVAFLRQIEAGSGRRVLPAPRGRPRTSAA